MFFLLPKLQKLKYRRYCLIFQPALNHKTDLNESSGTNNSCIVQFLMISFCNLY